MVVFTFPDTAFTISLRWTTRGGKLRLKPAAATQGLLVGVATSPPRAQFPDASPLVCQHRRRNAARNAPPPGAS